MSITYMIADIIGERKDMLSTFVSNPEFLVTGENARDIRKFFRFVTMSVTSRMKSQTPDTPPSVDYPNDEILL